MCNSDTSQIVTVWSDYGHRFIGGDDGRATCLTCGGLWQLIPNTDDPTSGLYTSTTGEDPVPCPGTDAGWAHGYPAERHCDPCYGRPDNPDNMCEHVTHNCNCMFCD